MSTTNDRLLNLIRKGSKPEGGIILSDRCGDIGVIQTSSVPPKSPSLRQMFKTNKNNRFPKVD